MLPSILPDVTVPGGERTICCDSSQTQSAPLSTHRLQGFCSEQRRWFAAQVRHARLTRPGASRGSAGGVPGAGSGRGCWESWPARWRFRMSLSRVVCLVFREPDKKLGSPQGEDGPGYLLAKYLPQTRHWKGLACVSGSRRLSFGTHTHEPGTAGVQYREGCQAGKCLTRAHVSRKVVQPLVLPSTGAALEQALLGRARLRRRVVRGHGLPPGRIVVESGGQLSEDCGVREGEV